MKKFCVILIILLCNLLYFTNKNKVLKQNPFSLLYSYEEDEKYYLTAYNLLKQKNIKFYIFDKNNRKKEVQNFKEIKFVLRDRMEAVYKELGNRFLNKKNLSKLYLIWRNIEINILFLKYIFPLN